MPNKYNNSKDAHLQIVVHTYFCIKNFSDFYKLNVKEFYIVSNISR